MSVLGKAVLGLGFFLCSWPRALCPRLHLCEQLLALKTFSKFTIRKLKVIFVIELLSGIMAVLLLYNKKNATTLQQSYFIYKPQNNKTL